jgi:NTP pyrophosphatase (non-canonical NTP hydrolase)
MAEQNLSRTLPEWQAEIGAWHKAAFPWAKLPHILDKLAEEKTEANLAWARMEPTATLADELADCLICILAAMAREGIDAELALASKLPRVMAKYASEQPAPQPRLPL